MASLWLELNYSRDDWSLLRRPAAEVEVRAAGVQGSWLCAAPCLPLRFRGLLCSRFLRSGGQERGRESFPATPPSSQPARNQPQQRATRPPSCSRRPPLRGDETNSGPTSVEKRRPECAKLWLLTGAVPPPAVPLFSTPSRLCW